MATIYSIKVFSGLAGPGGLVAYTVADGDVMILRNVDIYNVAGTTNAIQVYDVIAGHQFINQTLAGNTTYQWQGRQVFVAGDELGVYATEASAYFRCSGYLLSAT